MQLNIYDRAFVKQVNGLKLLTVFAKAPSQIIDQILNMPLLKSVRSNLICNGVKIVSLIMFLQRISVISWFTIHTGHSPATRANFSTNNSILSACTVFPFTVCFRAIFNYFLQLWWCYLFGHFDRHYCSFCQLPTPF